MNPTAQLEQDEPQASSDASPSSAPDDYRDFRYGRRYIRRVTDDGEVVHDIVPLALDDLLHPEEEDELVSRPDHSRDCRRLVVGLERFKPKNKTFLIVDDMNVDLGLPGVKPIRPDVCVCEVATVPEGFGGLGTLDLTQHAAVPLLFIEVTSASTRKNDVDVGPKFPMYEQAKVQQYILVDLAHPSGTAQLTGYEYRGHGLAEQQADEDGRLWLPEFELWIGLEDGQAVLYDKHGIVPDPQGWAEQAEQERRRAEQAMEREEQAKEREQQAKSQLEAEKIRNESAQERMRELEAELARLRSQ